MGLALPVHMHMFVHLLASHHSCDDEAIALGDHAQAQNHLLSLCRLDYHAKDTQILSSTTFVTDASHTSLDHAHSRFRHGLTSASRVPMRATRSRSQPLSPASAPADAHAATQDHHHHEHSNKFHVRHLLALACASPALVSSNTHVLTHMLSLCVTLIHARRSGTSASKQRSAHTFHTIIMTAATAIAATAATAARATAHSRSRRQSTACARPRRRLPRRRRCRRSHHPIARATTPSARAAAAVATLPTRSLLPASRFTTATAASSWTLQMKMRSTSQR